MSNQCFVCHKEDRELVRPCYNDKCTARVHECCLEEYYYCNSNVNNCLKYYIQKFCIAILLAVGHPILYLLTVGITPFKDPSEDEIKCFILYSFLFFLFWIGFTRMYVDDMIPKLLKEIFDVNDDITNLTLFYLLSSVFIISIRCIGYFSLKLIGIEKIPLVAFFTGILVTLLFLFIIFLIYNIVNEIKFRYQLIVKQFSKTTTKFGIKVE